MELFVCQKYVNSMMHISPYPKLTTFYQDSWITEKMAKHTIWYSVHTGICFSNIFCHSSLSSHSTFLSRVSGLGGLVSVNRLFTCHNGCWLQWFCSKPVEETTSLMTLQRWLWLEWPGWPDMHDKTNVSYIWHQPLLHQTWIHHGTVNI